MATEGVASIPIVDPIVDRATDRISGTLTLQDLLRGRSKAVVGRENGCVSSAIRMAPEAENITDAEWCIQVDDWGVISVG